MHVPSHFKIEDELIIDQFIKENSFGTLVSSADPYPMASHIPLELEINNQGQQVLWGHISKANLQWKSWADHPQVLAIFLSPIHSYISSSWYSHANVPTWNYMSVQVTGNLKLIEGEELKESLRRLTDKYEQGSANPVSLDGLPESVQNQMRGIVAFEIHIHKKEASFKLSQNRNPEDFINVIAELKKTGRPESIRMAESMEKMVR